MKTLKRVPLTDNLVLGHDIMIQIDPFFAQSLIDILKLMKYEVDPNLGALTQLFTEYYTFAYRLHSRTIASGWNSMEIDCLAAYHEGLHALIGLRFGVHLKGRPLMTLLNECIGQGLGIYYCAKFAQMTNLKMTDLGVGKMFISVARKYNIPYVKKFKSDTKDPFLAFQQTAIQAFVYNKKYMTLLQRSGFSQQSKISAVTALAQKQKNSWFIYHIIDSSIASLFIAANCGFSSTKEDQRASSECLKILKKSKSMDDFLIGLGVNDFLKKVKKKHV